MTSLLVFLGSTFLAAVAGGRRAASTSGDEDERITMAMDQFPSFVEGQLSELPDQVKSSWKKVAERLPYLTEAVAMWFVLWDPRVPNHVKLSIAVALLYVISPLDLIPDEIPILGQADDATVIWTCLSYVYAYVTQDHVEEAKAWLRGHGVDPKPLFALGKQFNEPPAASRQLPANENTR